MYVVLRSFYLGLGGIWTVRSTIRYSGRFFFFEPYYIF